jgi:hypothetical protein
MKSGHSFNALRKTLEEPHNHIKFLLATSIRINSKTEIFLREQFENISNASLDISNKLDLSLTDLETKLQTLDSDIKQETRNTRK